MAPSAMLIEDLLSKLNEEDCQTAISFIEYLSDKRQKAREQEVKSLFDEFQSVLDGERGWESEEDMLKEMAQFRKERLAL